MLITVVSCGGQGEEREEEEEEEEWQVVGVVVATMRV